jgi:hypothetical protein
LHATLRAQTFCTPCSTLQYTPVVPTVPSTLQYPQYSQYPQYLTVPTVTFSTCSTHSTLQYLRGLCSTQLSLLAHAVPTVLPTVPCSTHGCCAVPRPTTVSTYPQYPQYSTVPIHSTHSTGTAAVAYPRVLCSTRQGNHYKAFITIILYIIYLDGDIFYCLLTRSRKECRKCQV